MHTHKLFVYTKRIVFVLAAIFALAFLLSSCVKEEPIAPEEKIGIVKTFRNFYEEEMDAFLSSSNTKSSPEIMDRIPDWENAQVHSFSLGTGVTVPLDYKESCFIRTDQSQYDIPIEDASFLMMYTSEDNIIHGETVFFLDDGGSTTPAKGEKPHFSGIILVQDLAGTTKHGFISYPDGSVCAIRPSTAQEEPTVKSLICFTFETWQKGSLDRGVTWSNYILLSSYTSCFETFEPAIMTMLNPDDYAMGGGGAQPPSTDTSKPLTPAEINTLNQVKSTLSTDCATNTIVSTVWAGLSFAIDGSISTPAQYDAKTNTIKFKSGAQINLNNALEEIFHAFQNAIYQGGIGKYSYKKPGNTNIEFEAKLFNDIYTALYGGIHLGSIDFPKKFRTLYEDWVMSIASEGFTPALLGQYNTMLGYFNQYNKGYGGYLLESLNTPIAIIQAKTGCN